MRTHHECSMFPVHLWDSAIANATDELVDAQCTVDGCQHSLIHEATVTWPQQGHPQVLSNSHCHTLQ